MKVVLQVVKSASVSIDSKVYSSINEGFLLLLGIENNDTEKEMDLLINKIVNLRTFFNANSNKFFDKNLLEIKGETLIVSQFTLPATFKKGRRPEFSGAMAPEKAKKMYELFVEKFKEAVSGNGKVETGEFGADMKVALVNDGPITYILDSEEL